MASLSRASCDIASKIVTGRSAKTLFMEVMFMESVHEVSSWKSWNGSAAGPGRQSRRFPGDDAAGQMLVIGQARGLRRQRRRDRSFSRAAGEHHLLALRIGNILRIERRKRNDDGAGIGFYRDLVGLAHVDEQVAPIGNPLG